MLAAPPLAARTGAEVILELYVPGRHHHAAVYSTSKLMGSLHTMRVDGSPLRLPLQSVDRLAL